MADGYSRASGKPGVALVVPGAGVYNAASGVATAYARSSPMLLIACQIPGGKSARTSGHPRSLRPGRRNEPRHQVAAAGAQATRGP